MTKKELIQKATPEYIKNNIDEYKVLWNEIIKDYEYNYQCCLKKGIPVKKNCIKELKKYLDDIERIENKLKEVEKLIKSILFEDIEKHSKKFADVMQGNYFYIS